MKHQSRLSSILSASGWVVSSVGTAEKGGAVRLAREAPRGAVVCAVGGDGTVNEVVNGLLSAGRDDVLAVLPCGTGNDFVEALGWPTDPAAVAAGLATAERVSVDCGEIDIDSGAGVQTRFFCNVVGAGMDAATAERAQRLKPLLGAFAYVVSAVSTLASWSPFELTLAKPAAKEVQRFERALFVSVCNGPRSGGTFRVAPDATLTDGLLDVCAVEFPGFLRALRLLPGVTKGKHVAEPEVHTGTGSLFELFFSRPQPIHIDGELAAERVTSMRVRVLESRLSVLGPAAGGPDAFRSYL